MNTSGHLINNGGLRGHSVGELFPFMIVGIGRHDEWVVQHPNGAISKRYTDIKRAEMLAIVLKEDLQDGIYEAPKRN